MHNKGFSIIASMVFAAGLLVLAFGIFYFDKKGFEMTQKNQQASEISTSTENSVSSTAEKSNSTSAKTSIKPSPQPNPLSYTEAVNLYKDKRIQFASNCQVIPNFVTFKNSTKVMFDNRAPQSLSFSLDNQKYSLPAYGFKIITLYNKNLPHTVRLNCGTGVNNGQILLQ